VTKTIDAFVIFDGPPEHDAGRFIEVEDADGNSIQAGQWLRRENGTWALRLPLAVEETPEPDRTATVEGLIAELRDLFAATSDGDWTATIAGDKDGGRALTSRVDKAYWLAEALNDDTRPLSVVVTGSRVPAITGDGPRAADNALFIEAARQHLPRLLNALEAGLDRAGELVEGNRYALHNHRASAASMAALQIDRAIREALV